MSYSEGDDSEGNCGSFSVGDDEGESIDSSVDGDTKSDGDESATSESVERPMGVVSRAIGDQEYVLSEIFVSNAVEFDADDVCTDRIEAESRQKQLLHKLITPLGTKRKPEPAAGKLDYHVQLPPALCMRARSCRFICKAIVEIG